MQKFITYIITSFILFFFAIQNSVLENSEQAITYLIGIPLGLSCLLSFYLYKSSSQNVLKTTFSLALSVMFTALCLSAVNSLLMLLSPSVTRISIATRTIFQSFVFPVIFFGTFEVSRNLFSILFETRNELTETAITKPQLTVDPQLLTDPRFIHLAKSGLLTKQLALPSKFASLINNESSEKTQNSLQELNQSNAIRYEEFACSTPVSNTQLILEFAKKHQLKIITTDAERFQSTNSDVQIIDLNLLAKLIQPIRDAGETIRIKIQRYGKEPYQGVGYLDDGTMVVVNGGGDYIGETIETSVLSVKNTSAGRIIFTNLLEQANV